MTSAITDVAEVAVLIVGFNNPDDIVNCLAALSRAAAFPRFDVFICENGGRAAYERLIQRLVDGTACCELTEEVRAQDETAPAPFVGIRRLQMVSRAARVTIGCASANLGYAGGVNAWLRQLMDREGWKGVWILNPDTEPAKRAPAKQKPNSMAAACV